MKFQLHELRLPNSTGSGHGAIKPSLLESHLLIWCSWIICHIPTSCSSLPLFVRLLWCVGWHYIPCNTMHYDSTFCHCGIACRMYWMMKRWRQLQRGSWIQMTSATMIARRLQLTWCIQWDNCMQVRVLVKLYLLVGYAITLMIRQSETLPLCM